MFLGSFSSVDPGEFAGLTQQAGAQWWSASGSTWTVGIDDAASQKVASFWQGLIAGGGVDNQPQWTAAWNKGMNDGKYIAWVSDVWAPGDFPTTAPSGAGKWMMTELPQWTAGGNVVGNWGGSSTAVMAASKNQQAAAQFAAWLNTDPAATAALVSDGGIYPADTAAEAALSTPPSYFTNQPNFWTLAKQYAAAAAQVTWGPDVNVAYSEFTTAFGSAATSKGSFLTPADGGAVGRAERHEEERLHGRGRADVKHPKQRTAPRVAPYAFVAPAVVLYALVLLIPIGYTLYLSVEKTQVSGLGLGAGARRQVFAGLSQLPSRPNGRRVPLLPAAGCHLQPDPGPGDARARPAVRAAARRAAGAVPAVQPAGDLPAVRGADRHRLAAVGLPLPAHRVAVPRRSCARSGCPCPTCSPRTWRCCRWRTSACGAAPGST